MSDPTPMAAAKEMLDRHAADSGTPSIHCLTQADGTTYLRHPNGEVMVFDTPEQAAVQFAIIRAEARARAKGLLTAPSANPPTDPVASTDPASSPAPLPDEP